VNTRVIANHFPVKVDGLYSEINGKMKNNWTTLFSGRLIEYLGQMAF